MSEPADRPPWVWDGLPPDTYRDRWNGLVRWVEWLEDEYAPWVVLPPCWPAHESLRTELVLFWYWHGWLAREATDPVAGLQWHADLRRAAAAWRELSTCDHRPPGPHHAQVLAAQRRRRDEFVTAAMKHHRTG